MGGAELTQVTQAMTRVTQASKKQSDTVQTVYSLTEIELGIVSLMKKDTTVTITEISKELAVNSNTLRYYISKLKKMNIIEREGSSQKGYWIVKL